ncbi:MAG: hypothetical protein D6824_06325, partial [Planctomycetota bacterium]
MGKARRKLGEILVRLGAASAEEIEKAVNLAKGAGKRIGEMAVEAGFVSEEDLAKALAKQFGVPYVDLKDERIADRVEPSLLPEELVRKHQVLPLGKANGRLRLIVHDPMDIELLDMLRFRLNTDIEPILAPRSQIKALIDRKLSGPAQAAPQESLVTESIDRTIDTSVDASIDRAAADAPIIKLVDRILTEAVRMRASDIHVEPMADRVRLRYRIDG